MSKKVDVVDLKAHLAELKAGKASTSWLAEVEGVARDIPDFDETMARVMADRAAAPIRAVDLDR